MNVASATNILANLNEMEFITQNDYLKIYLMAGLW